MRFSGDYVYNNDGNLFSGKNEYYESTCLVSSMYSMFENYKEIITENAILCVNTNKAIFQCRLIGLGHDPEGFSNEEMVGHIWLNNDDLEVLFNFWIN